MPKVTATLKNKDLATCGFPKNFQNYSLKPAEVDPSLRKVNLPPAKSGIVFPAHAPLG